MSVHLFLLLILFLSCSSLLNAIPIDVNLYFEDDYVLTGEGYSDPDSDRYNLQKVSLEYERLVSTWFNLDGDKLTVTFLGEPLSKKTISKISGEVSSFEYPSVNTGVPNDFESVHFNNATPYILDKKLNTIWIWDQPSEFWFNIRDEYNVPSGEIYDIYFFDEFLHIVMFEGSFYSVWQLTSEFEKIDELGDEPEKIINYANTPIILNKNFVKKVGSEFTKVYYNFKKISTYHHNPTTETGVLLSPFNPDVTELVWYSFSENSISRINQPEMAEEWMGCSNYSTPEIHCMFQMGPSEFAIYKLDNGAFQLDSVFSFNDEGIDLRGASLFSIYGQTRIIQLQLEEENSSHLLEWSPIKSRTLSSTPDGQYHLYFGLNLLENKNYFIRSSEVGIEINKYDVEGDLEIIPLVSENEYPEYRVMKVEGSSSSNSGSGRIPIYMIVILLVLLIPSTKRH